MLIVIEYNSERFEPEIPCFLRKREKLGPFIWNRGRDRDPDNQN